MSLQAAMKSDEFHSSVSGFLDAISGTDMYYKSAAGPSAGRITGFGGIHASVTPDMAEKGPAQLGV